MKRGFYTILAAQFFSSLADNALLIAAIALLGQIHAPGWMEPLLKFFFTIAYVVLACFVGPFADSMQKGHVMLVTNAIKIVGCIALLLYGFLPAGESSWVIWYVLIAYAVVGIGAAAYSPAKYGILTELLPAEKLVVANGWIESLTVISIILGTVLGGALTNSSITDWFLSHNLPYLDNAPKVAVLIISFVYLLAAIINLFIPDTGARYGAQFQNPLALVRRFIQNNRLLWTDRLGQISLAVTTLLWGVGATLQFIVLEWAKATFGMTLDQSSRLVGIVAVGIAVGAVAAAKFIPLKKSPVILPAGIAIGFIVASICLIQDVWLALPVLIVIGAFAGFFIVPMNALLQHRGYVLMSAGGSIAVQNFNENLGILVMIAFYAMLLKLGLSIYTVILILCGLVSLIMLLITLWYRYHNSRENLAARIGEKAAHHLH